MQTVRKVGRLLSQTMNGFGVVDEKETKKLKEVLLMTCILHSQCMQARQNGDDQNDNDENNLNSNDDNDADDDGHKSEEKCS